VHTNSKKRDAKGGK
jgi:hypothetical protein